MDCHRRPQSHSEIMYNNEDIKGTATAVRSPIVKDIIMRTAYMKAKIRKDCFGVMTEFERRGKA